jgi:hypothetical protein
MNSEAWAGVTAAAGVKACVPAGVKARAEADSLNQSTILLINDTEGR